MKLLSTLFKRYFRKNNKIRFYSLISAVQTLYPITSSKDLKREWVSTEKEDFKIRQSKCPVSKLSNVFSINKCPAVHSIMSNGFIMYAPADFKVHTNGDDDSTLSATLAAVKLLIPIIHIEAGQRSGDKTMPEEINRILTDHCSTMLMCAEPQALDYLKSENLENYELVGNTAVDCLHRIVPFLKDKKSPIDGEYYVCTLHRPFNVDDPNKLHQILSKLNNFDKPVILPAHPRLKKNLNSTYDNIQFVDPMGYVDFVNHIKHSHGIISDSGGIQCEAAFWSKPIITLRPNTEHKTTLNMGNVLCPNIEELSVDKFPKLNTTNKLPWWWDGNASKRVVEQIKKYVEWKKI